MNINISNNKTANTLTLANCLEEYIHNHFYIAYIIAELAPIFLVGGAIRDLMQNKEPKDLDFIVLGKENMNWVLKVLKKFNIEYHYNRFGGFKFTYQGTEIDLWLDDDLFQAMQYNVDGLFFSLETNSLLSLTFADFKKKGIKLVNPENNIENGRELKLRQFATNYLKETKH